MSDPKSQPPIACPPEVLTLVERFDRNLESYRSGRYNETQLRLEFLNTLFEALGWDGITGELLDKLKKRTFICTPNY